MGTDNKNEVTDYEEKEDQRIMFAFTVMNAFLEVKVRNSKNRNYSPTSVPSPLILLWFFLSILFWFTGTLYVKDLDYKSFLQEMGYALFCSSIFYYSFEEFRRYRMYKTEMRDFEVDLEELKSKLTTYLLYPLLYILDDSVYKKLQGKRKFADLKELIVQNIKSNKHVEPLIINNIHFFLTHCFFFNVDNILKQFTETYQNELTNEEKNQFQLLATRFDSLKEIYHPKQIQSGIIYAEKKIVDYQFKMYDLLDKLFKQIYPHSDKLECVIMPKNDLVSIMPNYLFRSEFTRRQINTLNNYFTYHKEAQKRFS